MQAYRKLIVAALVPLVGYSAQALGWDMTFGEEQAGSLLDALIPFLTAAGVWAAPNSS